MAVQELATWMTALVGAALAAGCAAGNVDVTRAYTARVAATIPREQLRPVAVVRGSQRIPIPEGARLEATRVVLSGLYVHHLADGDVIEQDDAGHITGVRTSKDVEIHFVPGTAESPSGADYVRGQLDGKSNEIALGPEDRIEMKGSFAPDADVPGGGHVESTRASGFLVAGGVLLGLAYLPSAYIGAESHLGQDRALLVPVVGPWIDLATRPACAPPAGSQLMPIDPCTPETAARWALVTSGGLQGLGLILGVIGLPARAQIVGADRGAVKSARLSVSVVPDGNGAALVGAF
jgi:hypothetical protein